MGAGKYGVVRRRAQGAGRRAESSIKRSPPGRGRGGLMNGARGAGQWTKAGNEYVIEHNG